MTVMTDVVDLKDEAVEQEAGNVGDGARAAYLLRWAVEQIERLQAIVDKLAETRSQQGVEIERLRAELREAKDTAALAGAVIQGMWCVMDTKAAKQFMHNTQKQAAEAEGGCDER